jgi:hypothetical protein
MQSKEAEIDASVQLTIGEKIDSLKGTATLLAKKLENEKHKNVRVRVCRGSCKPSSGS